MWGRVSVKLTAPESALVELKDSFTIVIVNHNLQLAVRISDYSAFMLLGKMIESPLDRGLRLARYGRQAQLHARPLRLTAPTKVVEVAA